MERASMAATRARTEAGMPLDGLSANLEISGGGHDSDVVEEAAASEASDNGGLGPGGTKLGARDRPNTDRGNKGVGVGSTTA